MKSAVQVDVDNVIPGFERVILQKSIDTSYSSRVHQYVYAAESLLNRACSSLNLGIIANVNAANLTSTLLHLKALILFVINLKLHTTAFAFLKALLLFLFGFCLSSGFIRFCLNSAQTQYLYAASLCAPAWRPQRYKSLVARA